MAGDTFYLPDRGQRIFASSMTLNKPRFSVNRKYTMMVVSAKQQQVIASAIFWLRGEKEHYSGKVTFTDDETKAAPAATAAARTTEPRPLPRPARDGELRLSTHHSLTPRPRVG